MIKSLINKGYNSILVISIFLLMLGIWNEIFIYLAFFTCIVLMSFSNREDRLLLLFIFLPFCPIFRPNANVTSLFTYLMLYEIFLLSFKNRLKVKSVTLLLYVVLIIFSIVQADGFALPVKFLIYLAFLWLEFEEKSQIDILKIIKGLEFGLIVSFVFGFTRDQIPQLARFYNDYDYIWIGGVRQLRHSGVFSDPNYFSLCVAVCIAALIYCYNVKIVKTTSLVLNMIILSVIGILTFSRMFFILLVINVISIIICNVKKVRILYIIPIFLITFFLLIRMNSASLNGVLGRFSSGQIYETGRLDLVQEYLTYIVQNIKVLLFGVGVNSNNLGADAHNTVIQVLYYLGLVGGVFLCLFITSIYRGKTKLFKITNVGLFLTIILGSINLNMLFDYCLPFYLIIFGISGCDFESSGNSDKNTR